MWGLNKNILWFLCPKNWFLLLEFHDFASGFVPKLLYHWLMRIELFNIDIHAYSIFLFLRLRIYAMNCVLLLWSNDFQVINDKSHDFKILHEKLIIEYILTFDLESQEWVPWCFLEAFDTWYDLISKYTWWWERSFWDWVELGIHKLLWFIDEIYIYDFGLYDRPLSWLRWIS